MQIGHRYAVLVGNSDNQAPYGDCSSRWLLRTQSRGQKSNAETTATKLSAAVVAGVALSIGIRC